MIIYKITNKINSKIYIGQQKKYTENYYGSGKIIKLAIKKYGVENFKKEILQECTSQEELNEAEKFWIKKENSFVPHGYNISHGGHFGDTFTNNPNKEIIRLKYKQQKSKQHCQNISLAKIGKSHKSNAGFKLLKIRKMPKRTKDHRDKISKALIGKKRTKEICEKISQKLKGRNYNELHGNEKAVKIKNKISDALNGRKLSEEHKLNISKAQIGTEKNGKVTILQRKEIVNLYYNNTSVKKLSILYKLSRSGIYAIIQKNKRFSFFKICWRYRISCVLYFC